MPRGNGAEELSDLPVWYARRYPSLEDLEEAAWAKQAIVVYGQVSAAFYFPAHPPGIPYGTIGIPESHGILERVWAIAHELGHLWIHSGPKRENSWRKGESQADRWAARALIPDSAVQRYRNACEDSFIAALSKHYEDIPLRDCHERRLAAHIARIRLNIIREEVA